ncbi:MAG: hypothetical protein PHU80_05750 [Kiritimatiellae bacterium]|nr:hypothetical protein [Kiritimatiellia bacterium]
MNNTTKRGGFILPAVVSCLLVVGIIVGGALHYFSSATRSAGVYLAASRCRLSAQTALEMTSTDVYQEFRRFYQTTPSMRDPLLWFNTYSETSVGSDSRPYVFMLDESISGCSVTVRLTDLSRSPTTAVQQFARLTLQATSVCVSAADITVSRTIEETVEFAMRRSPVFNYAYFVNNYGWFQGGGVTANGDIRANGDLLLDGQSWVNGIGYAAINQELGAEGVIISTARSQSQNAYWTANDQRARPTSPTSQNGPVWTMGYEGTSELRPMGEPVTMPFLGELDVYRELAENYGSSIQQRGQVLVDACYSGPGPSGIPNGADAGCLILDGTTHPIVIDGPVVVNGDVVIRGEVRGQGAIYAGRNIYIAGDVVYNKPPNWPKPDNNPNQTIRANSDKDMIGLAAKGNIVLGDYTSSSWMSNVRRYITPPFVNAYACDPTDASIGYGTVFPGDYTASDGGQKVDYTYNTKKKEWEPTGTSDRRFYQSSVGDHVVQEKAQGNAITRIDAILYNNHAVMGTLGACQINGAMICRDEAIIYSGSVRFNWDIRLGSQSPDGIDFYIILPLSPARPQVIGWQEVQI